MTRYLALAALSFVGLAVVDPQTSQAQTPFGVRLQIGDSGFSYRQGTPYIAPGYGYPQPILAGPSVVDPGFIAPSYIAPPVVVPAPIYGSPYYGYNRGYNYGWNHYRPHYGHHHHHHHHR